MNNTTRSHPRTTSGCNAAFRDADYARWLTHWPNPSPMARLWGIIRRLMGMR